MKISLITENQAYLGNRIFGGDMALGSTHGFNEHWMLPYIKVKEECQSKNIEISTFDILHPKDADVALFLDFPTRASDVKDLKKRYPHLKRWVIILESPLFRMHAFDPTNLRWFDGVLSYFDFKNAGLIPTFLDAIKTQVFCIPTEPPVGTVENIAFKDRSLCLMINTYQTFSFRKRIQSIKNPILNGWFVSPKIVANTMRGGGELYSFRAKSVQEANRFPIDVYGKGWEALGTGPHFKGPLQRNKFEIMGRYRFNFCPENCENNLGYLSEKLLESFWAGVVPLYRGDMDIQNKVPYEAFIDLRNFSQTESLFRYLAEMTDIQWAKMRETGMEFIRSKAAERFRANSFAQTLVGAIQGSLRVQSR